MLIYFGKEHKIYKVEILNTKLLCAQSLVNSRRLMFLGVSHLFFLRLQGRNQGL